MAQNKSMAEESKFARPDDSLSISSLLYSFCKKVSFAGAVYLVGYMHWSVAWLICPLILSVLRQQWRKESDYRRTLAKAAAVSTEKEIVLARLDDLPSWVFFPDIERAEWLNRIIQQLWPNVNHFTRVLLKETIEPSIAETLANKKLKGFKFERMILGTIAPRIGGVKVYDKNVSRNEIIMDMDLFYAGDCDISFVLQGFRGGIKDLQIHGMMRIVMKPLINKIPLVGGLQVFFLNNPSIDFDLVGVADLLDFPGLSDLLRRCIIEQVASMMVLPNKLPIQLSDEIPTIDLHMPEPEGVLRIHLVQAENLEKKDFSLVGKGSSDPYAIITVGAQQWRSPTINSNVNPKWDYWCEARIMQSMGQTLDIEVRDKDEGNDDDKLGRLTLDITQVVKVGRMDTWQTLVDAKHGKVHLRLSWHKLCSDASELSRALNEASLIKSSDLCSGVLCVYIDSCENLPNARPMTKPDPYLTVTMGKKTETTGAIMRTDSPVYQIGYSFLVENPATDMIEIKALDQKTGNALGQLTYNISNLLKMKDLMMISQPISLQKSGPESKIVMAAQLKILKEAVKDEDFSEENSATDIQAANTTDSNDNATTSSKATEDKGTVIAPEIKNEQPKEVVKKDVPLESIVNKTNDTPQDSPLPSISDSPKLIRRTTSTSLTTSAGEAGLGRMLVSLRYSMQNQNLYVVVHKIMNIPLKDPTNIPDPYVKLYLLPGRSKDSKRKTQVIKDNCNPEFDEQFEWMISHAELHSRMVEITVATHKGFLGGSPIIGQAIIRLNQYDFREAKTIWVDLMPESTDLY